MVSNFEDRLRAVIPQPVKSLYRKARPRTMATEFRAIYRRRTWQVGSGHGSRVENTVEYRALLESFLREHGIRSVVDVGCGDWQFSHLVDWGDASYLGIDTVPNVIRANRKRYGNQFQFRIADVVSEPPPPGDLLIMKDVMQHWPTEVIREFIPNLRRYRVALITNSVVPAERLNAEIQPAGYRPLDLRLPPFELEAIELLRYHTDEVEAGVLDKLVLLVRAATD